MTDRSDAADSRLYTAVAERLKERGFSPWLNDIRDVHERLLRGGASQGVLGRAIAEALREEMGDDQKPE